MLPDIKEAPYDLVYAIAEALTVLSWFENLPDDEQPPRHIWWSEDLIAEWFRNVKDARKKDSGGSGQKPESSYERSENVPMSQNELIDRSGSIPKLKSPEEGD